MNVAAFIGGVLLVVVVFFTGWKAGSAVTGLEAAQARAGELDKIVVRQQVLIKEVPKIVTKVVTRTETVTKEVDRVVLKVDSTLAPDCVLPRGYGGLLVAAAQGVDPDAPGGVDASGEYGCAETLKATLSDLKAGWRNTARLQGLQDWAKLVTKGD